MNVDLTETNASRINTTLLEARRRYGSASYSAVLTLVVVSDERGQYDAVRAAVAAAREHPARILAVIPRPDDRPGSGKPRLDAEVRTSGESGPGEVVVLRLHGELARHAESVVLPLLLPDAPVVTWWPGEAPGFPAADPLGALGARRITDAAAAGSPLDALRQRARGYAPGDTDLAWTRLTPWRSVLASALDVPFPPITGGGVVGEAGSASAELLACWLRSCLEVSIERRAGSAPGVTEVVLHSDDGDIGLRRLDPQVAMLRRPGSPERPVALSQRPTAELLAEELRRLDADDVYGRTLAQLAGAPAAGAPSR
ncbi:MAG: glucose-6-phosphate dehydrogenase assembly protein OpcA [Actinomycetota bacterium]|nr:glucose-6-phosphate dehydrogenase assembly protein OpcA [Actinomycetota bacterium]